jgi:hypothetical protein
MEAGNKKEQSTKCGRSEVGFKKIETGKTYGMKKNEKKKSQNESPPAGGDPEADVKNKKNENKTTKILKEEE